MLRACTVVRCDGALRVVWTEVSTRFFRWCSDFPATALVAASGLETRGARRGCRLQTVARLKVGIDWKLQQSIMAPGLRGHLDGDEVGELPTDQVPRTLWQAARARG